MSYQVLARRWRPQAFDQMVGQEHVLQALVNALERNRLHHAYLLTGTRGVGKTTLARLVAKCLNCEQGISPRPCGECSACREIAEGRFVDLLEVDAASRTKVEDTRELLENVQYAPARGRFKVYLIDEVHMLSGHSFNALLKTLEEPPPHVKFLLATTDPQKLPATVLSRCLQLHLRNLAPEQIAEHLAHVLSREGIESEQAALWEIALAADGSMRDALSLTDQAIAHGAGRVSAGTVTEMLGYVERGQLHALLDALLAADAAGVLGAVATLAAQGCDCERVLAEVLVNLHRIALVQAVPAALDSLHADREQLRSWAAASAAADVQLYYQLGLQCRRDLPWAPDARSGLEMALLRMLAFRPAAAPPPDRAAAATATRAPEVPAIPKKSEPAGLPPAGEDGLPRSPEHISPANWADLVAALELSGMARSVAMNAVPGSVAGDSLELVIDPSHASLQGASAAERLSLALAGHFGRDIALRFREAAPGAETPASREARIAEERRLAALERMEADPNVRVLLEGFGGQLHRERLRILTEGPVTGGNGQ